MKKMILCFLCLQLFTLGIEAREVYVGGDSIGIQITYDGVMISGTYDIDDQGAVYNPTQDDLQSNDIIVAVNGVTIKTVKEMARELAKSSPRAQLTVSRNNEILEREISVFTYNSQVKTGLFVKDELLGIGTLTYVDPKNKSFASLGHEIIDVDTQKMVISPHGNIYRSKVISINKAKLNKPGEKNAQIDFDSSIGDITYNSQYGVFGKVQTLPESALISTASMDEIVLGDAEMLTVLENEEVVPVKIRITDIHLQDSRSIKGIEFEVVDEHCLQLSNGIVQGMSGSPILQNDHLIGAVTHVATSKPNKGYGIFIDWMLMESDAIKE